VGQKTNPKAFRLVTTQKHLSKWYSKKTLYANLIQEDSEIREKIQKILGEFLSLSTISISRAHPDNLEKDSVNIVVSSLLPRAKELYRKFNKEVQNLEFFPKTGSFLPNPKKNLRQFTSFLLKKKIRNIIRFFQLKTGKDYYLTIQFIKNPFEDTVLIAKYIGEQLQKRIPFRRAIKQAMKKVENTSLKGIKIQVSGRLNGVEIARSEWKREGKVPLHTLRAKIDYIHHRAETIYGVIGIKVWLFSGEEIL
jgi:small subunit ribosomal protein S3